MVGGSSPLAPELVNLRDFNELPQGLYASARAEALAAVDRLYDSKTLIVVDLSNDATYAEVLFERFGPRVIGIHITRSGDGERKSGVSVVSEPVTDGVTVVVHEIHDMRLFRLQMPEKIFTDIRIIQLIRM